MSAVWRVFYLFTAYVFCRELEAKAAEAAREIEGSSTNKLAIELENGEDEAVFSDVVRSGSNNRGMYMSR